MPGMPPMSYMSHVSSTIACNLWMMKLATSQKCKNQKETFLSDETFLQRRAPKVRVVIVNLLNGSVKWENVLIFCMID